MIEQAVERRLGRPFIPRSRRRRRLEGRDAASRLLRVKTVIPFILRSDAKRRVRKDSLRSRAERGVTKDASSQACQPLLIPGARVKNLEPFILRSLAPRGVTKDAAFTEVFQQPAGTPDRIKTPRVADARRAADGAAVI